MKLFKISLLLFLPFCLKAFNQTYFKANVIPETNKIYLNKNLNVKIQIEWIGKLNEYSISEPYIEKFYNFELISTSVENIVTPLTNSKNFNIIRKIYTYNLKPTSLGMAYFPKSKITIMDKNGNIVEELETPSINIEILKPLKKINYKPFLIIILIIFLLSILFVLFFHFYKKYKLKKEEEQRLKVEQEKSKIPIEFKYISQLNEKYDIIKNPKEFYYSCDKILKNYIEEKFQLKIKEKSTFEIINILTEKGLAKEFTEKINKILEEIDLVKFASKVVNEIDKSNLKEDIITILEKMNDVGQT